MWPLRTPPRRVLTPEGRLVAIGQLTDPECRTALTRLATAPCRDVDQALADTVVARIFTPHALPPGGTS